jgi:flagellar motility protein MotE (MotC chaperone)
MFVLQDIVKMAKYRKRCFDQIEPTFKENQELTTDIDRLREKLEAAEKEKAELETSRCKAIIELSQKEHERTGKLSSCNSPSTEKCCNTYSYTHWTICRPSE